MIFEGIARIIAEKLDIDVSEITMESNFTEMKVDSLYMVEIMLAIEEEFNIVIEDATGLESVKDLVEYVSEQYNK